MERSQAEELLKRYRNGATSPEENAWVESWYLAQGKDLPAFTGDIDYVEKKQQLWDNITQQQNERVPVHQRLWPRIAAAASIILALSVSGYFLLQKTPEVHTATVLRPDIAPGSEKAVLTLANGQKVDLVTAHSGSIARQAGVTITKTGNAQLVYTTFPDAAEGKGFNTIETPKGGEYQVILPDGSHVWLNAASSLKYPINFSGNERRVALTGEAYFEIAHNKAKPFRVISGGQTVEVLGTHFNIMAYGGEAAIKTTLLEGSVKVSGAGQSEIIAPGEQASVNGTIQVGAADTELAVAWKNGKTYFKDADIPTMMRSLSRWYNVEIEYRGSIPERLFTGGIPRKSNLSTMLKILNEMNIHARIEGRKIIVTP